jgi:hypothetical protein
LTGNNIFSSIQQGDFEIVAELLDSSGDIANKKDEVSEFSVVNVKYFISF